MRSRTASTLSAYGLLALAGAVSFILPDDLGIDSASARGPYPEGIHLVGMVRDFQESHSDFNNTPSDGNGRYAGLISDTLGADSLPVLGTPGNRVITEARDDTNRNIAAHLAGVGCGSSSLLYPGVVVDGLFSIANSSRVDGYDSSLGLWTAASSAAFEIATNSTAPTAFSIANSAVLDGDVLVGVGGDPASVIDVQGASTFTGNTGTLPDTIPMPTVTAPVDLAALPVEPGYIFTTELLSSDRHFGGNSTIQMGATVTVSGHRRILVQGLLQMDKDSRLYIPPGNSLEIYCTSMKLQQAAWANCTSFGGLYAGSEEPDRLRIFNIGTGIVEVLTGGTRLCARIWAPNSLMSINQGAEAWGTALVKSLNMDNTSRFHVDGREYGERWTGSGGAPIDTPATLSATDSNGGITTVITFSEWFRHVPGRNMSTPLLITLVDQGDGTWFYDDGLDPRYGWLGGFHPIDDKLMGNEGASHNSYWTYSFDTTFTYDRAAGQFVVIAGDADIWAFVDNLLAIDLGGPRQGGVNQRIDMNRLCLIDGQVYTFTFFMAERNSVQSRLWMRTNIAFRSALIPGAGLGFD